MGRELRYLTIDSEEQYNAFKASPHRYPGFKYIIDGYNAVDHMFDRFFTSEQLHDLIRESFEAKDYGQAGFLSVIMYKGMGKYGVVISSN